MLPEVKMPKFLREQGVVTETVFLLPKSVHTVICKTQMLAALQLSHAYVARHFSKVLMIEN